MTIRTTVPLLRSRRTKIVATLGPVSREPAVIARLIEAGVDVFRLNLSHGSHDEHRATFERVRAAARTAHRPVAVLADLAGPKIRVGGFPDGSITLAPGERVTVTTREVAGAAGLIPSQYEGLARDLRAGDRILLADGVLELAVESVRGTEIECSVVQGGVLSDRKGINLPGVEVSAPSLTDKDRGDARFLLELGVDYVALSFVRRGADVEELRALLDEAGRRSALIAKIEKPEALADIDAILDAADGIMVARGDLGVELPPEQVPVAQRFLTDRARRRNRSVIVATQMLESMIRHSRPTRAEVADVSHTVMSGADAIMLSAETASGAHPVAAVQMMDRIARQTEGYLWSHGAFGSLGEEPQPEPPIPFGDAVARSTALLSRDLLVRAIVAVSRSGMSAATVSAARPAAPVIAVSASHETCRRMNLLWGTIPVHAEAAEIADPIPLARRLAAELELAKPGEFLLVVRGFDADPLKNAPTVTVLTV